MRNKLKNYWFEILILCTLLLGFFLLLEQINIRGVILDAPGRVLNPAGRLLSNMQKELNNLVGLLTPSNVLGFILVFAAVAAVLWRLRSRFLNSDHWNASACPKCGSSLHRIHRSGFDRFLSRSILPDARRYLCSDPECGWEGLLRQIYRTDRELQEGMISNEMG